MDIKVINAWENNLKNISVDIPIGKITTISGVSGSGKSSLIYDVIASEATRKEKIDSGNADMVDLCLRTNVEEIKNLPYCETLKQKGLRESISSSVATISGIHELLRDEFVKNGEIVTQNGVIKPLAPPEIPIFINKFRKNSGGVLYAQLCENKSGNLESEITILKQHNINNVLYKHPDKKNSKKTLTDLAKVNGVGHSVLIEICNLEQIKQFVPLAKEGFVFESESEIINFNKDVPDLNAGIIYSVPTSRLFSFNSTEPGSGRCEHCNGSGRVQGINENSFFSDRPLSTPEFVNLAFDETKGYYKHILLDFKAIAQECKKCCIDVNKSYAELSCKQKETIKKLFVSRMLKHQNKESVRVFLDDVVCDKCNGSRLNYKANAVRLFNKNISEILSLNIIQALEFLSKQKLHHHKIIDILNALKISTLEYITLDRTLDTLSGGELQRLKLAMVLQNKHNELLYILDEPSVGLHPYNNSNIIALIKHIVAQNNTVIISEHNAEYIKNSDFLIKLGQGSGVLGGNIIYDGAPQSISEYTIKRKRRQINSDRTIKLFGVNFNNIRNENFTIPLGALVVVSGISGSGKSSLAKGVLIPLCVQFIESKTINKTIAQKAIGLEHIGDVANLAQKLPSTNIRSIVATFLGIFDDIRTLFARENSVDTGFFSFNSKLGQCDECRGHGHINKNMCYSCLGSGFNNESLEMLYNGLNINEVLNLDICSFEKKFSNNHKFARLSSIFIKLGLSHLSLGRRLDTLSGGELQRLMLAKELIKNDKKLRQGNMLFVLDEPTRGLDSANVQNLVEMLDDLLEYGNSVVVIEHNTDFIKNSDFVIDMGPLSGCDGGKNLYSGEVENIKFCKDSITAKTLYGAPGKEEIKLDSAADLKSKRFNFDKGTYQFNRFLLDDKHFLIEKEFADNYKIEAENEICYFKNMADMINFANTLNVKNIYFNPLTRWLYKYKIVPQSIQKQVAKKYKKLGGEGFDCRVEAKNLESAYNLGLGWLSVECENEQFLILTTRLISLSHKIVGSRSITPRHFSLYVSACEYCKGTSKLQAYNTDLFVADWNKSVLDDKFLSIGLKLKLKAIVSRFAAEGLFDFGKPFNFLSNEEKNIFLYGFKPYKFLKAGGRENALGDYIAWNGLHAIIYENLGLINNANEIRASKHDVKCPFCNNGFKKEMDFYKLNNKSIASYYL